MKPLESKIYIEISIHENMSMSEIIEKIQNDNNKEISKNSRITIIRAVNNMKNLGFLNHNKVSKGGKRKRYSINEDNTKQDLTARAFTGKKQKRIIPNPKVTQKNLSQMITKEKQFYKYTLTIMKKEPLENYYTYHLMMMSHCLEWITRLTLAINSGMLGDSKNKIELAKRNKERYEQFLQTLVYNIKTKNEKLGNDIVKAMYNMLVDLWFLENVIS